jgi:predicted RNase H-like HicB family nuclease
MELELPVAFLREGRFVVAYTPSLDISTSGKTVAEAKRRFGELVRMFIDDLIENNNLDPVLLGLGWKKGTSTTNTRGTWIPPQRIITLQELRIPVNA